MKENIFKNYDIRGIYPDEIDNEAAYKVGRALVRFLSAKMIVIGKDARVSSPALSEKLIEGITCEGADVVDIGMCTTPMLNFAVAKYGYDGGVMISASHNPAQYNALKLIRKGPLQLDFETGLNDIKTMVLKGFPGCKEPNGAKIQKEVLGDYLLHVLNFAEKMRPFKIVVDYGNGVGAISAKPAFARLDLDEKSLYEEPNGEFPNHPANPHDLKNFDDLIKEVEYRGADLGIFFDGDADRAIFVDNTGRVVPTDLLFVLLSRDDATNHKREKYFFDLRFSKSVPDFIKKFGGVPVMMKVGNPLYKKALKEKGGRMAAEFSGHIMFSENYGIDDGLFAVVKTLNMLSKKDEKLSELIDGVREYSASEEVSVESLHPEEIKGRLTKEYPKAKSIDLDGIYLDLPDGFISVRQSQTEPQLFRIRVEAKIEAEMKKRLRTVVDIVKG